MVTVIYKSGEHWYFELHSADREMDFCIDVAEAHRKGALVKYKVTNTYGIVRLVTTAEIKNCRYTKTKTKTKTKERVPA